jgi:CBS domain-containing protein
MTTDVVDFDLPLDIEPVSAAYTVEPLAIEPNTPLRDSLAMLKAQKTGSLVICRDGVLVGIFTERDALKLIAREADLAAPIDEYMTTEPATLRADATVGDAIRKMSAGGYRRLPIVDAEGRPQGLVKVSGIVRYLVEHFPEAVYNLPPQPNRVAQDREGA